MTESKHTPGPWTILMDDNYMRLYMPGPLTGDVARGYVGVANANLIAAAPELLAALEEANAYISDTAAGGRYIEIKEYVEKVRGVTAKINAAINKAKGINHE